MFDPRLHGASPDHRKVYGFYERLYTVIDLVAALSFVIGSVMFFSEAWMRPGTWLFLIGSICFAIRPAVRFLREFHLAKLPLPSDEPQS
ncbi:MAG: YrhK family protein [Mangrovicoccus sp.]